MRRALERSREEGKSREAASTYANFGVVMEHYEGPEAAVIAARDGIEFCERRGIADAALGQAAYRSIFLVESGLPEQALLEAESLAEQAEASGHFPTLNAARCVQLRVLAQRGDGAKAIAAAERLVSRARESGIEPEMALAFNAAAQLLLAAGRPEQAKSLLGELEQVTGLETGLLPQVVRSALAVSAVEMATRLVESAEAQTPLREHALVASRAQLAEHGGQTAEAATLYAEAAARWRAFGNVPERGYALLGQGRCLAALGEPGAEQPLCEAGCSPRSAIVRRSLRPRLCSARVRPPLCKEGSALSRRAAASPGARARVRRAAHPACLCTPARPRR
jgi:tetratricopeptide (TPR) repeat protein